MGLRFPLRAAPVDRLERVRRAPHFLAERLRAPLAQRAVYCQPSTGSVFLRGDEWRHPATAAELEHSAGLALIGETHGPQRCNVFALPAEALSPQLAAGGRWVPAREAMLGRGDEEAALMGLCCSTQAWLSQTRFCSRCGAAVASPDVGLTLQCGGCGRHAFPSVTPAIIVAVLDGRGNILLSERRDRGPDASGRPMRTVLAGFVSPGEAAERTVEREVLEESGAVVGAVHYAGSQPWPFPDQLMLAYYAHAGDSPNLRLEEEELVHVEWTSKDEIRRALAGDNPTFFLPPPYTVAHALMKYWADGAVDNHGCVV